MKSREFCYWLQGHFEINTVSAITENQKEIIVDHLKLVFEDEEKPGPFCQWLKGYFDLSDSKEVDLTVTKNC